MNTKISILLALLTLTTPALSATPPNTITIQTPTTATTLTPTQLANLPQLKLNLLFGGHQGPVQTAFQGPLLWTILIQTHAINPNTPKAFVSQYLTVTGSDGYTTVIAMGEIAPEFEAKQVILALQMNGKPLGAGHARIVIPGDKRAARSVYDVMRIALLTVKPTTP